MKIKITSLFSIHIFGLILALAFLSVLSNNIFGQNGFDENKVRTVYVISNAKEKIEITRPRVINVSNNNEPIKKSRAAFDLEKAAFQLINQKRAELGLPTLHWSDKIANLARQHSLYMADYKFFSHQGLNGQLIDERATDLGIEKWKAISENIAFNKGYINPVEFAVERWMQSASHRQNLLNPRWQQSGIGVAITSDGAYYFTQVFLNK
ncbi:MAG: CAP domain-containing protein [Acidobacteriota bacterium]|jgi:uncharacterized protein YkwD|nr:CAP domain-containing protein [Acidobacteriota bacterium]